nr:RNA-directed DNA polymerase, eukaryota, reverse transcriptase zinc-binding domain protein [Tanacetum cinerariifolium]
MNNMNGIVEYDGDIDTVSSKQMKDYGGNKCDVLDFEENKGIMRDKQDKRVENNDNNGINDVVEEECRAKNGVGNVDTENVNFYSARRINKKDNETVMEANREGFVKNTKEENDLFFVPTTLNEKDNKVGRYEVKDIMVDADKMCYFKFRNEEGISTISSRLGRPIKMDKMTVDMCKEGSGRLGFARFIVEINAKDEYPDKVEITYVDEFRNVKITKRVNEDGFVEVKNIRNTDDNNKGYYRSKGNKQQVRHDVGDKYVAKPKALNPKIVNGRNKDKGPEQISPKKIWKVSKNNVEELRKNKYAEAVERMEKDKGDSKDEENTEDPMNDIAECMSDNEINGLDNQLINDGNNGFMGTYLNAHAVFLPHMTSDHSPDIEDFVNIIEKEWKAPIKDCEMFKLAKRLKNIKIHMKNLSFKKGNLLKAKEASIIKEYNDAVKDEESSISQQAKIDWLKEKDGNNKFFMLC